MVYSTLMLLYDERFTKEEKLSIFMTHYEHFTSKQSLKTDVALAITAGIVTSVINKIQ